MADTKLTREKELETVLTICVMLVVFYFLTKQQHRYLLTISVILGLIGMFSKYATAKIAWAWMKLSEGMGFVSSKIILSVVFFIFLFPIALMHRAFGNKDSLQLQKPGGVSCYYDRGHKYEKADLENTW